jgi:hypothetical protein
MDGHALRRGRQPGLLAAQAALGLVLAVFAASAAPSSALLPGPNGGVEQGVAMLAFCAIFAVGLAFPVPGLYAAIALTVLEGAIRKWVVNDVTVFLLKDFLLIGVYAAVLPKLSRRELRRPWWLVVPLGLLLILALVLSMRSPSYTTALIGLRSYSIYVPLLWVAPAIVDRERRARALLVLILALGIFESALAIAQALAGPGELNKLVSGAVAGVLVVGGIPYLRPTGTFMQVGNLSSYLVFVALAAFATLAWRRDPREVVTAVVALLMVGGAIVYSAARTLLVSMLLIILVAVFGAFAARRSRRIVSVGAAAVTVGVVLGVFMVPWLNAHAHIFSSGGGTSISGDRVHDSQAAGGFLGRAADVGADRGGLWRGRVRPGFVVIGHQGLVGHGTGTMTLGLEYAAGSGALGAETSYAKAASELGLPGLVMFVWFVGALLLLALRGFWSAAASWERACAAVGLGAAVLVPLWMILIFSLDLPIVAELYYVFTGLAAAVACGASSSSRNTLSNRAAIPGQVSSES